MPGVVGSVTVTSKQHEHLSGERWRSAPLPLTEVGFAQGRCVQHLGTLQWAGVQGKFACEQLQVATPQHTAGRRA